MGQRVLARPFRATGDLQVFHRLVADQHQGHHFERTERCAPREGRGGRAREIEMVIGPDDASRQVEGRSKQRSLSRERRGHEPKPGEEEGDDCGGEHFEEAFHPEVDHPPAPVFDHADMRMPAVHEARAIKQRDGSRRDGEHHDEMAPFTFFRQGGPDDAEHEDEPNKESKEQTALPDSPEVKVLPTLMAPVEGSDVGKLAMDAQVLANQ